MLHKGLSRGEPPSSIGGLLTRGPALWKEGSDDSSKKSDDILKRSFQPAYKTIASGTAFG